MEKRYEQTLTMDAPLSPHLAFVVQFRMDSSDATQSCTGRVEHMTSGRMTHFCSQAELWTFLTQVLAEEQRKHERHASLRLERLSDEEL